VPDAWKLLVDLGLPDGAIRPQAHRELDADAIRDAVVEVARSPELTNAKVAPFLAWLRAWRHHWPARFAEVFGSNERLLAELEARLDDVNRYLKLRRIAIANLSRIL